MYKWGREIQTVNKMVKLGFRDVISLEYTRSKKVPEDSRLCQENAYNRR